MIVLPIVTRELRVAARKRTTYWNRSIAGLLATLIILYVLASLGRLAGPAQIGAHLFSTLSRLSFLCCLFAGVFLTADCLSQEKRDGTLGLLFLTDLQGYDVVLGKLIATSLNGFYGLLAVFPILALPLDMGGVTFGEFCRVALALVNTLLFSLAVGIFISVNSWKEQRSMFGAAGMLVIVGIIFPAIGFPLEWASPRLAFRLAQNGVFQSNPWQYALALLSLQAIVWGLLLASCRRAPRTWQMPAIRAISKAEEESISEKDSNREEQKVMEPSSPVRTGPWEAAVGNSEEPAGAPEGAAPLISSSHPRRKELLESNPVLWLASRNRSSGWVWGSLAVFAAAWFAVCLRETSTSIASFVESFFLVVSLHGVLKFWIAWEACRHFYENRRNGTLESLLCAPLTLQDIMRGHFKSLFNQFVRPVTVVLVLDFFLMSWLGSSPFLQSYSSEASWSLFTMIVLMLSLVVDAFALGWVGLWLGLKGKKSWTAAFGTLARIILLPNGIAFVIIGMIGWSSRYRIGPMAYVFVWGFVGALNSVLFGLAAHSNLYRSFREAATQTSSSGATGSDSAQPETAAMGEYFSLFQN